MRACYVPQASVVLPQLLVQLGLQVNVTVSSLTLECDSTGIALTGHEADGVRVGMASFMRCVSLGNTGIPGSPSGSCALNGWMGAPHDVIMPETHLPAQSLSSH